MIPEPILRRVENVDILAGVDPIFAGLHSHIDISDGRSYRSTPHVVYSSYITRHKSEKQTTVVLPVVTEPWVVIHELGHVLDELLGFEHIAKPVTRYAETNQTEAFAEAFTAWIKPPEYNKGWLQDLLYEDKATIHLFESLLD